VGSTGCHAGASPACGRHAASTFCRGRQRAARESGREKREAGLGRAEEGGGGPLPAAGRNRGGGLLRLGFDFSNFYFQTNFKYSFQTSF
jgi:hypothetical protein